MQNTTEPVHSTTKIVGFVFWFFCLSPLNNSGTAVKANSADLTPFMNYEANFYVMAHVLKFSYPPNTNQPFPRTSSTYSHGRELSKMSTAPDQMPASLLCK